MRSPTIFPSRLWTMVMNQGMLIKTLFLICTTILHMSLRGPLRGERSSRRGSQSDDAKKNTKHTPTTKFTSHPLQSLPFSITQIKHYIQTRPYPPYSNFNMVLENGYGYGYAYENTFLVYTTIFHMSLRGPLRGERSSRRGSQSYDNYSKLTKTLSYIYIPNHNPTLLQFRQSYGYGYGYDFQYTYTFTIHAMVMVMGGYRLWLWMVRVMIFEKVMVMVMGGYRLWLWVIMVMIFEKVMVMIFERVWLYVRSFVYIYVNMIYM